MAFGIGAPGSPAQAGKPKSSTLVVPGAFPTIQSAVDAAAPGDTIRIRAGTFTEQVRVGKDLTIVGSGKDRTVIRAPATLEPNEADERTIVDVTDGATVSMSWLSVSGPGSGTCEEEPLLAGIRVRNEAHLDLRYAAVRDIHDTPMVSCFRSANGILVGDIPDPIASLTVRYSEITNYAGVGIVVLGFGSTATITHNVVKGPGLASGVGTGGIEFPVGAVGTISYNVVSGNECPPVDPTCGPDWFTQFQLAGIGAGGWGPGTVVSHNIVFDNHVGLLMGESDEISHNLLIDNSFFGMGLIDGTFRIEDSIVRGGGGGVWVIAESANSFVELDGVRFRKLSGPTIGKVECCGFTATVVP